MKALVLAFTFVHLPIGTLGDIYSPVNAHIAVSSFYHAFSFDFAGLHGAAPQGIYPTIVVVLVGLDRSLNDTAFWESDMVPSIQVSTGPRENISHIQFNHDSGVYSEDRLSDKRREDSDISV